MYIVKLFTFNNKCVFTINIRKNILSHKQDNDIDLLSVISFIIAIFFEHNDLLFVIRV